MVLASALQNTAGSLLGLTPQPLALRVCGSEHDGFILRLRSPKCTVGSDPTCTLRLRSDEIRPFHCLILRGAAGTFVRRWSAGTTLNGAGFDLAPLRSGDRLRIGTVEFEVLPDSVQENPTPQVQEEPLATAQAESNGAQILALQNEVSQCCARLEQQECDAAMARSQLEAELVTCHQQLAEAQSQHADRDRSAVEESLRELAACHEMAASLRAELDRTRDEQAEQREMGRLDREQIEAEFADALATAQSREQRLEEELRAIRTEVESWRQVRQRPSAQADVSPRPVLTELMSAELMQAELMSAEPVPAELVPAESGCSTLALDPRELTAAALKAVQCHDAQDNPGVPPIADACSSALANWSGVNAGGHPNATGGEEDASEIRRYMERLLRRVGNSPGNPEPPSAQFVPPVVEPAQVGAPVSAEPSPELPQVEPLKRRESATAEAQRDLIAMRELAQRSTRMAITNSDHRTQVKVIIGELCVAGICLISGILAAALSRSTVSVEIIGGVIGISFGLVLMTRAVHHVGRLLKDAALQRGDTDL